MDADGDPAHCVLRKAIGPEMFVDRVTVSYITAIFGSGITLIPVIVLLVSPMPVSFDVVEAQYLEAELQSQLNGSRAHSRDIGLEIIAKAHLARRSSRSEGCDARAVKAYRGAG